MNKTGIAVVSFALLGSGILFLQGCKTDSISTQKVSSSERSENFATWQDFKPRSGLFTVRLPHPPQYAKDLVPIPGSDQKRRYDMYASEKIDGTLFLISVITYPSESEPPETGEILKQTVDELMKSKPDNQLTKLKETLYKTYRALDFSIVNREFHVEGKAFMIGKNVYVLSYVTRKNEFNAEEFDHFVNSFELIENQSISTPNS